MSFKVPEEHRIQANNHPLAITPMCSSEEDGNNGAFTFKINDDVFMVIASDEDGWEHVSISTSGLCPTWEEMCLIKDMFWGEEDTVIQYHPAKSNYINNYKFCLHMWRPINQEIPTPPTWMVGIKGDKS